LRKCKKTLARFWKLGSLVVFFGHGIRDGQAIEKRLLTVDAVRVKLSLHFKNMYLRCRDAAKSALGFFVPLMGRIFGCKGIRCSLKIELCDKLEPLGIGSVS
jgi:hypothetical protein